MHEKLRVVELFAGVGGFRLGLEGWSGLSSTSGYTEKYYSPYYTVWSNQWEPATKRQHASEVYVARFGNTNHSNENIENVKISSIPDHDVLVGGFPCQDYSVATTLKNSGGLRGKKGVLWWSIERILREKSTPPNYLILENVDRLLASPAQQRGRDFAVMLTCLNNLGYAVEWKVINAAEYGFPQRRKRIFLVGYHRTSTLYKKINREQVFNWIAKDSVIGSSFPSDINSLQLVDEIKLPDNAIDASNSFNKDSKKGVFKNSGFMLDGLIYQVPLLSNYQGSKTILRDILVPDNQVPKEFFIQETDFDKWVYLKGSKKELRKHSSGFTYNYSEGPIAFPDNIEEASRTIITGEGGQAPSRFKHVINTKKGLRRLTPIELERLNMFPDDFTKLDGISDSKRAFFMGNALVVGVVELLGKSLYEKISRI